MPPQFIENIAQGSDQWRLARMGKATASNFGVILSEKTGKYSEKQAGKYAREVAIQRVLIEDTERPLDGLYWVERGKAFEPKAAQHYEKVRGRTVKEIGLIISEDGTCACSPDRLALIPPDNHLCGVEIKVPSTETHLEYAKIIRSGEELYDYRWQILGSIHVSQLGEWDFCSYNPKVTEIIRTYRRDDYLPQLTTLSAGLRRFEEEVQEACALLRELGYVEAIGQMRTDEDWAKMIKADPKLFAIA
jgi:YqaJ-like viral recombinase domain